MHTSDLIEKFFETDGRIDAGQSSANATQVGGAHYAAKPIQPWDFIAANGLGYFEGNVVKYLSRWRDKGGVQDLHKAAHYLQKLIEIETNGEEG